MAVIEVDIIFDFVCAWCYIGKRQLEMAISLYQKTYPGGKSDIFAINWRPYYLNYGPSTHSIDKSEVADVKLAGMSAEQREMLYRRMNQIGRSVGINFKSGGKVGDTRFAHTLVRLASTKEPEVLNSLVEGIFQAYHELKKDISTKEVLREIAINSGIAAAEVDEWLDSEEQVKVVDDESEKNKEFLAGAGVPNYTVQEERLDGQPDAEDFMGAFIKAKGEN
ncbi:DSBA domain-containing protein [Fusarium keratoplasticum]|uniref:DSBA domain-containing protein n=1 Tax=Fusarium keratoplasticum TaxID=1328300 RepID=A0ACC0R9U5_9HYPO|nr:DSBA domain-containing protein [Fusarium keratoplasticum]KAI8679408.1 DSBA domain-containing protein [Fusarium keratoplasticum]KAI8685502.1 DSBA domain-containing protein [Fusarium keratoplasticum]